MKSYLQCAVLLVVASLSSAQIVKISSTVIHNGSVVFTLSDNPDKDHMLSISESVGRTSTVMFEMQPRWITLHAVDPTPDINVIDKEQVMVYFSGLDTYKKKSVISVAISYRLSPWDLPYGYYMPIGDVLYVPGQEYNLTEPTLVQSQNGYQVPVLLYSNFTHIYSAEMMGGLFYTGDVAVLSPSLEWEGGAMRSPRALEHNGEYFVLYTAADGVTVGALRSQHHGGPYQKNPRPVGVLRDARTNIRTMRKDNINWAEDGWPYL